MQFKLNLSEKQLSELLAQLSEAQLYALKARIEVEIPRRAQEAKERQKRLLDLLLNGPVIAPEDIKQMEEAYFEGRPNADRNMFEDADERDFSN